MAQTNYHPTISICIPTFNRASLLDQTLQSVAFQTTKPFEVLIVDNASTDNTAYVVAKYKKYGFRYIRNKSNVGMIENWNIAIRESTGSHISFLHSDDLIAPTWHEIWIKTIKKHSVKFYTSALAIIDDANNPKYVCFPLSQDQLLKQPNAIEPFFRNLNTNLAPTAASVYDRSIFNEIGFFNPTFGTEADVVHSFNVLLTYDFFYKNTILFAYRSHSQQGFDKEIEKKNMISELKRLDNYFAIIEQFYKKKLNQREEKRFFIQIPLFMTLCPINLYIIKLQFRRIIRYYKIARKHFPDLFKNPTDLLLFAKIQIRFIQRALYGRYISKEVKKDLLWLSRIKNYSSRLTQS